jgi:ribosomal subunit interface protein
MTVQVTGKNIETSAAFQDYITDKINSVLEKYIGPEIGGHVRVEKERGRFHTSCSIRLRTGLLVEAEGHGADAYQSADTAIEHLEKRVRRYKRRLKNHHQAAAERSPAQESAARDAIVDMADAPDADDAAGPVIVAETQLTLRELPVNEAVLQLDLTDQPFLVFRNAAHGFVNVVYRRADGHIGWIDPAPGMANGALQGGPAKTR